MSSLQSSRDDGGGLLPTRASLLDRLRDWEDQAGWREFFNTYWKFIYSVAIRSGLSDQEAEDVVQETVLSVAKKMPDFVYDPTRCSFKGWLMHVTRLRIMDQLRRRQPAFQQVPSSDDDSRRTATVERVPDPQVGAQQDAAWDDEWERNLVDAALERVKLRVRPDHYQIFHLSAVKGLKTGEVARMLQVSLGQVYLIRHRLAKEVKREVERLKKKTLYLDHNALDVSSHTKCSPAYHDPPSRIIPESGCARRVLPGIALRRAWAPGGSKTACSAGSPGYIRNGSIDLLTIRTADELRFTQIPTDGFASSAFIRVQSAVKTPCRPSPNPKPPAPRASHRGWRRYYQPCPITN